MTASRTLVDTVLEAHAPARRFLAESADDLRDPEGPGFRVAYARAARRLGAQGGQPLHAPPAGRPHWTMLDWTRLSLLLRAFDHLERQNHPRFVLGLLEGGEIGEQESLLRTLAALPHPDAFTETGVAACRTNAVRVFAAMACENEYPAAYFSAEAFNQMVLKAIFLELPVQRVEGLERRATTELARMALAYASERRAAGRSVPGDVELIARYAAQTQKTEP